MKHQTERSHPEIKWSSSKLPFLFAFFSSIYVLLSDNYLASAFKYPTVVLYANIGKAIIFIILSAFLLDFVIRRDRKQIIDSQRQLQENERALHTLINSLPDAIYLKDGEGRWMQANQAALQFFGIKDFSYRGKNDAELYKENGTGDSLSICHVSDEYAWSTGKVFRHEESFEKEDGSVCTYDVIKTPVFDSKGNPKFLAVTARNITERKKIETELMKSKQRYQGLYNAISGG